MTCECVKNAIKKVEELGYSNVEAPIELLSGRLYLEFKGVKSGQKKARPIPIMLSKCPFCGKKIGKEVPANET